jgi:hypothetical protein
MLYQRAFIRSLCSVEACDIGFGHLPSDAAVFADSDDRAVAQRIKEIVKPDDTVIVMGAGDIFKVFSRLGL